MPKTVNYPLPEAGESLFNSEEKLFDDIKAQPGEKAYVFIHTVPYEGSVALVNLLTSTRLVRKGFDVSIVLYGPGVLLASGTRGYPKVGQEAFPGHLAINNQLKTLMDEGATDLRLPLCHGCPLRLRRGQPHSRRQGIQPARRARLGTHRVAREGVSAQYLDGLSVITARTGVRRRARRPRHDGRSARGDQGGVMDGIADMGGMQGWGAVKRPGDEPVFGEKWEGRAFALGLLSMRTSGTNLDSFRHALDRQSPMNYIADGYYGRWLPRGRDAARRLVDHRARRGRGARPQPAR